MTPENVRMDLELGMLVHDEIKQLEAENARLRRELLRIRLELLLLSMELT
jgi:hypothetical protein